MFYIYINDIYSGIGFHREKEAKEYREYLLDFGETIVTIKKRAVI